MTTFTPKTYEDAHPDHDGSKVPCDGCGRKARPFVLVDVRTLPDVAGEFLCDGCRSDMYRRKVSIDGNPNPPETRKEWRQRWVKAHGAPQEVVDKIGAMRETGRERDKKGKGRP